MRAWLTSALASVSIIACSGGPPVFPRPDPDRARECGGADGGPSCPTGQVCLQERCFAGCASDATCAVSEQCSGGACVPRAGFDGGTDAGPPCMGACDPALCHPLASQCVACTLARDECGGATGACDIASGTCVAPLAQSCAPCSTTADCVATDGSFTGECIERDFFDRGTFERVCALPCAGGTMCPPGFTCDGASPTPHCVPAPIGVPCTNYRAGITQRACTSDANCAPLGALATDVQYVGACNTATSVCLQPCSMVGDMCAVGGTACTDSGGQFFCRPP